MFEWVSEVDSSGFCKGILNVVGRPVNGSKSWPRMCAIMVMYMCCLAGNVLGVWLHWQDMGYRFTAVEDFFVLTYEIAMIAEVYLLPNNAATMFSLMDRRLMDDRRSCSLSTSQRQLIDRAKRTQSNRLIQFILMCCFFQLGKACPQLINGLDYMLTHESAAVDQKRISMPVQCWYPFAITDVYVYVACAATQLVTSIASLLVGIYWFTSSQASLIQLLTQIDLLNGFILDIDRHIQTNSISNLIVQHQQILRSVKEVNGVMQLGMLAMNYFVVFVGCFNLYGIVIIKETAVKIKYSLTIFTVCVAIFFNCWIGQQLINKSDELRLALLNSSWTDKRIELKRSLHLMTTIANKPMQITPFRLYTLNYNNLTTVTKAAYSCFNVLLTIHIKSVSVK